MRGFLRGSLEFVRFFKVCPKFEVCEVSSELLRFVLLVGIGVNEMGASEIWGAT